MALLDPYFNGTSRAYAGAIVTLVDLESGALRVEHRAGYSYEVKRWGTRTRHAMNLDQVLGALMNEADTWPGRWRVRCISTPASILRDLQGRADTLGDSRVPVGSYEATLLTRIGRIDMWEGTYKHEADERRRRIEAA